MMNEKPFSEEQAKRIKRLIMFEAPRIVEELAGIGIDRNLDEVVEAGLQMASMIRQGMTKSEAMAIIESKMRELKNKQ